jgi:hypothetical protein
MATKDEIVERVREIHVAAASHHPGLSRLHEPTIELTDDPSYLVRVVRRAPASTSTVQINRGFADVATPDQIAGLTAQEYFPISTKSRRVQAFATGAVTVASLVPSALTMLAGAQVYMADAPITEAGKWLLLMGATSFGSAVARDVSVTSLAKADRLVNSMQANTSLNDQVAVQAACRARLDHQRGELRATLSRAPGLTGAAHTLRGVARNMWTKPLLLRWLTPEPSAGQVVSNAVINNVMGGSEAPPMLVAAIAGDLELDGKHVRPISHARARRTGLAAFAAVAAMAIGNTAAQEQIEPLLEPDGIKPAVSMIEQPEDRIDPPRAVKLSKAPELGF